VISNQEADARTPGAVSLDMRPLLLSALLLVAVAASSAQAQPVTVYPASPTNSTPVTLSLTYVGCIFDLAGMQRTGNTIDLRVVHNSGVCVLAVPSTAAYQPGLLPAGQYTVRVVDISQPAAPQVLATSTFVVVAASVAGVPTLNLRGILVAMLLLGFAGSFALRIP